MSPEEFMKEYELANRSHDLARVRSLIAEDALFWFSNGGAHIGVLSGLRRRSNLTSRQSRTTITKSVLSDG